MHSEANWVEIGENETWLGEAGMARMKQAGMNNNEMRLTTLGREE